MFTGKRKQKPYNEMSTVFTELAKSVVKKGLITPNPSPHSGGVVNLQTYTQNIFTK